MKKHASLPSKLPLRPLKPVPGLLHAGSKVRQPGVTVKKAGVRRVGERLNETEKVGERTQSKQSGELWTQSTDESLFGGPSESITETCLDADDSVIGELVQALKSNRPHRSHSTTKRLIPGILLKPSKQRQQAQLMAMLSRPASSLKKTMAKLQGGRLLGKKPILKV